MLHMLLLGVNYSMVLILFEKLFILVCAYVNNDNKVIANFLIELWSD